MKAYHIQVGVLTGIYTGDNEAEALEQYAFEAGYNSYQSLKGQHGSVDEVTEIDIYELEKLFDNAEDYDRHGDSSPKEMLEDRYGVTTDQVKDLIYEFNK